MKKLKNGRNSADFFKEALTEIAAANGSAAVEPFAERNRRASVRRI